MFRFCRWWLISLTHFKLESSVQRAKWKNSGPTGKEFVVPSYNLDCRLGSALDFYCFVQETALTQFLKHLQCLPASMLSW